ncbi:RING finger protein 214 [Gadus morhua]|uniref:RING finger protein 214 n=1 Tax=Gadus morhua TaxID=8049 RepID=UPI0011B5ACF5|nr:RING finger protein 214 [Gadus morhua]
MTDVEQCAAAMLDGGREWSAEETDLVSRHRVEEEGRVEQQQLLQAEHKRTVRQHQLLLQKLDSLRVKLQLNDSKVSRKSFLLRKQEMTSQKNRAQEENNRLQTELEEVEQRLSPLQAEQEVEQRLWEAELSQLTEEMERVQAASREVEQRALEDGVVLVERQREATMASMEFWLRELRACPPSGPLQVGQYLQALQLDPSPSRLQERLHWERQEASVRRRRDQLPVHFQGLLQQLGEGGPLEAPPGAEALPKVPTAELIISQILMSLEQAAFLPPPAHPLAPPRSPPPPRITPPTGHQTPPPPRITQPTGHQTPPPSRIIPHSGHQTPPPPRITPPTGHQTPPPSRITPPTGHQTPPPSRITPVTGHQTPPPSRITPPTGHQTPPPHSGPVGKLDLLLDHLAAKFKQCSRARLTVALQHIKSERGTMAGLSRDELTEQVGLKLAPAPRPAPRPAARSFCLMCQNPVEPAARQPLACAHCVHRQCISVWLSSSGNNSCPFCPAH